MESRAEQAVASPTWGGGGERSEAAPARARRTVDPGLGRAGARDVAGAVLVLGGTAAMWVAFLLAVW